ncbi:hypothetical protein QJS04_geneDACA018349 [Acorus gramineus]|uniref:Uncharacterized protein n=1 Tax=Acorus gramineus TaxID=55184 RepID=A0AAV8ZZ68_ACOGR|nr:hypothetical protein QJS04_geneDACA018349 [Acorus gramineus]
MNLFILLELVYLAYVSSLSLFLEAMEHCLDEPVAVGLPYHIPQKIKILLMQKANDLCSYFLSSDK